MTTVVIGSSGQLATHLRRLWPDASFWGRETLDAADTPTLERALIEAAPRAIVMAAGFTAVDRAEDDRAEAWRLNAEAPAAAAIAADTVGAALVHVSTDYVFDGNADSPYRENAPTHPLSNYGRTKLAGELAVQSICRKQWIIRTSWLFSEYGANFVKTVLKLAGRSQPMRIVADQFGTPTYAGDLARLIDSLNVTSGAPTLPCGTYHATGGRVVSWHEFAGRIVEEAHRIGLLDVRPEVQPIPTAEFPTPAERPLRAVLEPSAGLGQGSLPAFDWERGLGLTLTALHDEPFAGAP